MCNPDCMDDDPDLGRLYSAAEAHRHLGIPAATVRAWHHRRRTTGLHPQGRDNRGCPLYAEADLVALAHGRRIRDHEGRRLEAVPA